MYVGYLWASKNWAEQLALKLNAESKAKIKTNSYSRYQVMATYRDTKLLFLRAIVKSFSIIYF